jgi:excisionase family DNA binding protein
MDAYLSIAEVAEIYGVSAKTVRRWIARGEIIAGRTPGGRLLRIEAASLDGILEPVHYRGYTPRGLRT